MACLDERTRLLLEDLDRLLTMQEAKRQSLGSGMIRSFDSLKFFVLYMGTGLVVIVGIRGFLVVRSIVRRSSACAGADLPWVGVSSRARIMPATTKRWVKMSQALMGPHRWPAPHHRVQPRRGGRQLRHGTTNRSARMTCWGRPC